MCSRVTIVSRPLWRHFQWSPSCAFTAALGALLVTTVCCDPAAPPRPACRRPRPSLAPTPLLAHQALYTLTLDSAKSSDVIAARGTMGYEVTDACDGWAVRQRLT